VLFLSLLDKKSTHKWFLWAIVIWLCYQAKIHKIFNQSSKGRI